MRLQKGLILRYVDGMPVVVPLGEAAMRFNGMIRLNESGALLWQRLSAGADRGALIAALMEAYEVTTEQAQADVETFLAPLFAAGFLEA